MIALAVNYIYQHPGSTGSIGLMLALISRWLEGPSATITFLIGVCTLIVISPKAYRQVRIWCRFSRRHLRGALRGFWPSRKRGGPRT